MRGFTLLELIVAIAILASIATLGLPKLHALMSRHESHAAIYSLKRALSHSRFLAQKHSIHITLCPIHNRSCNNNWEYPLNAFHDVNLNGVIDGKEQVYFTQSIKSNTGYWNKSKIMQNYVRFNPLGHAFSSASTFLYCTHTSQHKQSKGVILNFQGRSRIQEYLNSEGAPYSRYARIACD